jgi:hypothetical protein
MNVNGPVLVFGVAATLSGCLMTFCREAMYTGLAPRFMNREAYLLSAKVGGPLFILLGIGLFIASLTGNI